MLKFQDLYESYASKVYRFAFWLAGDGSDAEDITSETFIRAWAKRNTIRTETLKAYLMTIARNVFLERQRKKRKQVAFDRDYRDPTPGPEKQVESRMEILRVQNLLQTFPEIDREAFILWAQHELPYAEIARALELTLTNVKVKVHRVRKKLLDARFEKEVSKR